MTIADLIIEISTTAINLLRKDGSMPPGHNGPYYDNDTPVRNTSHWLITFSKAYELTKKDVFIDSVAKTANYLLSNEARPYDYSFIHRTESQLDSCNGLIGQAWTIEALVYASNILGDQKYVKLAEDVFLLHRFNNEYGLWHRLEINGTMKSIDDTFNHQLWFAACASTINHNNKNKCDSLLNKFISRLPVNMSVFDSGLIFHPIKNRNIIDETYSYEPIKNIVRKKLVAIIKGVLIDKKEKQRLALERREKMIYKSIGYHQFNMYAFALLKSKYPENNYWKNPEFQSTVNYLMQEDYKKAMEDNSYGFPYNPPGFEIPYALERLSNLDNKELIEISSYWVSQQIEHCYNYETKMMDRNTVDSITHTARLYELTRMLNLELIIVK